ncbi:MAG TPA: FUSC family protein [Terriglobales bacterium]|jgi:uncharacterized membrane protein YccC|nr:FUSC family protein [Terriglobales bacterium]
MWRSFARLLTQFDRTKLEPAIALRNAVGVLVPLAIGVAIGMPLGGVAVASGALQVAYSDGHDPYSQRGLRMLTATLLCALAVVVGGLTGHVPGLAILAVVIWGFAAGFAIILGADAESLGVISLVMLIIYAAQGLTIQRALNSGLLALLGGLVQTALSIALWPLARHEPERRALAELYSELSQSALAASRSQEAPPSTAEVTRAQDVLGRLGRDHGNESQRLWALLNQAERLRLSLLTLGRLRTRLARQSQQSADLEIVSHFLQHSANLLDMIASTLVTHKTLSSGPPALRELQQLSEQYRSLEKTPDSGFPNAVRRTMRRQLDAVAGQLRAAFSIATNQELSDTQISPAETVPDWRTRVRENLAKLQANLSLESPALRHAVRFAATLAVGEITAHLISARRSYWLPMTIALVLKPEFTVTFSRGLLRIAGTLAGLVLSTALFRFLHPVTGMEVVLIGVFVFLVRWIGPANYGIFAINVSALVVLLVAFTGVSPTEAILTRGIMTTLGGVIALAAYVAWPTWESARSSEVLARMLDAYHEYFRRMTARQTVLDPLLQRQLDAARIEARRARSQLEASIDRLRMEPVANEDDIRVLNAMLASSHRFINATMALEGAHEKALWPQSEAAERFAQDVEKTLELLSAALRGAQVSPRQFPDLREDHHALVSSLGTEHHTLLVDETDRITNSLNTLREQILAWRGRELASPIPEPVPQQA